MDVASAVRSELQRRARLQVRARMRGAVLRASDTTAPKSYPVRMARAGRIRPLSKDLDVFTSIIEGSPDPLAAYRMLSDGILGLLWYLEDVADAADERLHSPSPTVMR